MKKSVELDINSERIQEIVREHGAVLIKSMDGMAAACQIPGITEEERASLLFRSAAAYAHGICKNFNVSPEAFAELIYIFGDVKITIPHRTN